MADPRRLRIVSMYCPRCHASLTYPTDAEQRLFRRAHLIPGATHRSDVGRAGFDARLPDPPSDE